MQRYIILLLINKWSTEAEHWRVMLLSARLLCLHVGVWRFFSICGVGQQVGRVSSLVASCCRPAHTQGVGVGVDRVSGVSHPTTCSGGSIIKQETWLLVIFCFVPCSFCSAQLVCSYRGGGILVGCSGGDNEGASIKKASSPCYLQCSSALFSRTSSVETLR